MIQSRDALLKVTWPLKRSATGLDVCHISSASFYSASRRAAVDL